MYFNNPTSGQVIRDLPELTRLEKLFADSGGGKSLACTTTIQGYWNGAIVEVDGIVGPARW